MGDQSSVSTNPLESNDVVTVSRLLQHLQNPQNLLGYMVFTAWAKFMGIYTMLPSITIG